VPEEGYQRSDVCVRVATESESNAFKELERASTGGFTILPTYIRAMQC